MQNALSGVYLLDRKLFININTKQYALPVYQIRIYLGKDTRDQSHISVLIVKGTVLIVKGI